MTCKRARAHLISRFPLTIRLCETFSKLSSRSQLECQRLGEDPITLLVQAGWEAKPNTATTQGQTLQPQVCGIRWGARDGNKTPPQHPRTPPVPSSSHHESPASVSPAPCRAVVGWESPHPGPSPRVPDCEAACTLPPHPLSHHHPHPPPCARKLWVPCLASRRRRRRHDPRCGSPRMIFSPQY